jgi:putative transposase
MPWLENSAMDQKLRFIAACQEGLEPMSVLCERYGISRETGYKYLRRYRSEGVGGLSERSRAPLAPGRAMAPEVAESLLGLRAKRPHWGPKKLRAYLEVRRPELVWPAASSIGDLLRRHDLVQPRRRRRRAWPTETALSAAVAANDVWCADFKGWFCTADGQRCDPLTVTDAYSRYLLTCGLVQSGTFAAVHPVLEALFKEHGLPKVIRTDNGPPFAGTGAGGLSRLAVWWLKLGICPERIEPGHPEQNGRHERMHRTLKQAVAAPPAADPEEQRRRLADFQLDYNHQRPHEALAQRPPASLYRSSPRPFPRRLREPKYPVDAAIRQVRSNGEIKWAGDKIFVSEVLIGEPVAISETEAGNWMVRYFDVELGLIDRTLRRLRRLGVARHPQP